VPRDEKYWLGVFFGAFTLSVLTLIGIARAAPAPAPPPTLGQIRNLPNKVIMAIPKDDSPCASQPALIWGAAPLQKYADEIGAEVLGGIPSPDNLRSIILAYNPPRLYIFGHGNDWAQTVERCEVFLTDYIHDALNLDLVKDRYVHLLACLTAKSLGPAIIEAGGLGYFGYIEEFWLIGKATPGCCRFVDAPVYGDIEIERAFNEGEINLKVIYDRAINRYNEEIAYWEENWDKETCNGTPITSEEAQILIGALIHNRDALKYYPEQI
jgi:hypothetical protein